ncbi:helix-turn-helix domain-containing protein [Candidatus Woesebacteria bacterium]|nr:helix-turn-helix domain-containing protein [Candidatus Woesebacteria bacterium]
MHGTKQYQELLEKSEQAVKSGFPISFIGMYECGVDYLYGVMIHYLKKKDRHIIPVGFIKTEGKLENTLACLSSSLSLVTHTQHNFQSLAEVWTVICSLAENRSIIFLLYFDEKESVDLTFLEQFLQWRFLLSVKLNWIVCTTYSIFHHPFVKSQAFEKMIKTNITPMLPLEKANAELVFKDFHSYFGPISKKDQEEIFTLSGGNAGIMKALYLLARKKNLDQWKTDENLTARVDGIINELDKNELSMLYKKVFTSNYKEEDQLENLIRYGYIKGNSIFSPLVKEYLKFHYDQAVPELSTLQRKVFQALKKVSPEVVTRDEIAKLMWGKKWQQEYSDWAIDRLIYTMRGKLKKSGSKAILKTKRNKGYYIEIYD